MARLTKKSIGCFRYSLRNHESETNDFGNYKAFFEYNTAIKRLGELEDSLEPIPAEEWHEDDGFVIWWRIPVEEPPYCGTPLCDDFIDDYYTHFTRINDPEQIK